jgi:DNA-binding NarL/FixJ family response regulator
MIRVLLADDQALVRAGFRALLDAEQDIAVVGEAREGREALALARSARPDFELDEYVFEALRSGASGFLVKDTEPVDLIAAVRLVAGGEALLSPSVTRRVIEEYASRAKEPPASPELGELTEREVMALVAVGLSNEEVAARLVVSPATAKTHVSRAMVKLSARDRAQLVVLAYESGLVRPGWVS